MVILSEKFQNVRLWNVKRLNNESVSDIPVWLMYSV
jgi:hypothetical protein